MIRVCFIGDSHLAPLKFGMPLVAKDFAENTATFFASPGKTMQNLSLSGDALIPGSDALAASLELTSDGLREIRST